MKKACAGLALFLAALLAVPAAWAQPGSVAMDGVLLAKRQAASGPNGRRIVEFISQEESFQKWTRMVAYRFENVEPLGNDPIKFAQFLADRLRKEAPESGVEMRVNPPRTEALLSFAVWAPDKSFIEFNTFRYTRAADGKGVVSLQLAARLSPANTPDPKALPAMRQGWLVQATGYDMAAVERALASK